MKIRALMMRGSISILFILLFFQPIRSQGIDSLKAKQSCRKKILWTTSGTLYAGGLIGLNQLWYRDYDRSNFHFFDDNSQWLGMDKAGHLYSAYISAHYGIKAFEWAGYNRQKSAWLGGGLGWSFLLAVEIMDAHSSRWGFSGGDLLANSLGSSIAIAQYLIWEKQLMRLKISYKPSEFREMRPEILGQNELQGLFKDYNAQTYWASFNLNALDPSIKPDWLSIAVGYGGSGLIYSDRSYTTPEGIQFNQRRQYYLSLDVDLEKIPSRKAWLRNVLSVLNMIKLPMPTMEWEEGERAKFHWLYF